MLHCPHCFEPLDDACEPCPACGTDKSALPPQTLEGALERHQPPPRLTLYQGLTEPRFNVRKRYVAAAVLAALLLLGREGGFVNWYLFSYSAASKTQTPLYGEQYVVSGDRVTYTRNSKDLNSSFTDTGRAYGLGFQTSADSPLVVDLKDAVEKGLKSRTQLTASVEEMTISGLYWLPLFKHGSIKYRVRLQVVGKDSLLYAGVLEGVMVFTYSGLCSVRTLKQSLREQIASKVVKSVDSVIRE